MCVSGYMKFKKIGTVSTKIFYYYFVKRLHGVGGETIWLIWEFKKDAYKIGGGGGGGMRKKLGTIR